MVTLTPRPKQNEMKSPLFAPTFMQELPRRCTSLIDLEFDFMSGLDQQSVLSLDDSPKIHAGFADLTQFENLCPMPM